jgi:hypothetical protein
VTIWTEVAQPGIPPAPLFINSEATTVTLLLQPLATATAVTVATPAVQATYFVIVNQMINSGSNSRRKRRDDVKLFPLGKIQQKTRHRLWRENVG